MKNKRRPKGEGTLLPIAGSKREFYAVFPHSWTSIKGILKTKSPRFRCFNLHEGKELFNDWIAEREADKKAIVVNGTTVGAHIKNHWDAVKANLAITTRATNQNIIDRHILSDEVFCLSDYTKISSNDCLAWVNRMNTSAATKVRAYRLTRQFFADMVKEGLISKNPIMVSSSKLPHVDKSPVVSFTIEEQQKLIESTRGTPLGALILVCLDAGLRQSEATGLLFSEVNFKTAEITIRRALHSIGGRTVLVERVKTPSSRRTIRLSQASMNALSGLPRHPCGHVFCSPEGHPWNKDNLNRVWRATCLKAGVRPLGSHSLRHSMVCNLLRAGAYLPSIASRGGWKGVAVLLDVYSNSVPNDSAKLASMFDDLIG